MTASRSGLFRVHGSESMTIPHTGISAGGLLEEGQELGVAAAHQRV